MYFPVILVDSSVVKMTLKAAEVPFSVILSRTELHFIYIHIYSTKSRDKASYVVVSVSTS